VLKDVIQRISSGISTMAPGFRSVYHKPTKLLITPF